MKHFINNDTGLEVWKKEFPSVNCTIKQCGLSAYANILPRSKLNLHIQESNLHSSRFYVVKRLRTYLFT